MLTISLEELPGSVFEQSLLGVSDSFDGYWKDHPFIPLQSRGFWDGKSSRGLMVWHLAVFPMDDLNTRLTGASSRRHGFKVVFLWPVAPERGYFTIKGRNYSSHRTHIWRTIHHHFCLILQSEQVLFRLSLDGTVVVTQWKRGRGVILILGFKLDCI